MAADKKPMIVIKKITVVAGGAHGGAWKVAFADFMTAMMAFFLVMWLLATASEQTKKNISDHFSTPSIIEYQFHNFGVELTLEKLFLDLINEPLKVFQAFVTPADRTPNIMAMGMKKIVMSFVADQLGDLASNVDINSDSVQFEIPDDLLFMPGTATPSAQFDAIMSRISIITQGLEEVDLAISSIMTQESSSEAAGANIKNVADARLTMIENYVRGKLEHDTVEIKGRFGVITTGKIDKNGKPMRGSIKFEIQQKDDLKKDRKLKDNDDALFSEPTADKTVYDNFVKKLSRKSKKTKEQN